MAHIIIQGDARFLPVADASVHLVVTSPPYNADLPYDGYTDWLPWADWWWGLIAPAMTECFRVLVPGGRLCLNLAHVVRSNIQPGQAPPSSRSHSPAGTNGQPWAVMIAPRIWTLLESLGFLPREQLTWIKAERAQSIGTHSTAWGTWMSAQNPVLRAVAEPIFIASKGSYSREPGESDLSKTEFKGWTRNVWMVPVVGDGSPDWHPATFPPELARRLVKLYSYVGDTVLDPFSGAGTTVLAATRVNRNAIGLDISTRYSRLANIRCSQVDMFAGAMPLESVEPEEQMGMES